MAILAIAVPILPGKKEMWIKEVLGKMLNENREETDRVREKAGVHERTFLQETPDGDFVIITLEGDNPEDGWGKIMQSMSPELQKIIAEIHGMDLDAPPPPLPKLIYDSKK